MKNESILGDQNFEMIVELAKLRKENPKKYKELMGSIKIVMKDMYKIVTEVLMEVAKELDKFEDKEEASSDIPNPYY